MNIPPLRLLAKWSAHEAHGLNAIAANLSRDNGNGGEDAEVPAVTIFTVADNRDVARALTPPKYPAWIMWADGSKLVSRDRRVTIRDVNLGAGLFTKDAVDAIKYTLAFDYLSIAAEESIERYQSLALSQDYRQLGKIVVQSASLQDSQLITMAGEGATPVMWGFVTYTARIAYPTPRVS